MKVKALFNRKNLSSLTSHLSSRKGFTLIELLIVIAILGILAAGIVVVINPMEKINSANMAKAETFASGIRNSLAMNLVGEWTFTNSNSSDTSGYSNTTTVCPSFAADRNGQVTSACSFDGVDDYVDVGSGINYATFPGLTLEAWVKRSTVGSRDYIISSGAPPYQFEIWNNNTVGVEIQIDSNDHNLVSSNTFTSTDWAHLAFTHDLSSGAWYIYVNGNRFASGIQTGTAYQGTGATRIGNHIGAQDGPFGGSIDDVRIYKHALTMSQIQQLYARGLVKHQLALK